MKSDSLLAVSLGMFLVSSDFLDSLVYGPSLNATMWIESFPLWISPALSSIVAGLVWWHWAHLKIHDDLSISDL